MSEKSSSKRRVAGSYFISLMSITLVLFLLGVFALLMMHAQKLSNHLKENIGFEIVMNSNVKEANCTYEGEKTYKCSRCQEEKPEKEILPVDPDKHVDADNDNICDLCEKTIKEEEVKKNFFQRVIDFFKRIFDWIKNLFTRNKDN